MAYILYSIILVSPSTSCVTCESIALDVPHATSTGPRRKNLYGSKLSWVSDDVLTWYAELLENIPSIRKFQIALEVWPYLLSFESVFSETFPLKKSDARSDPIPWGTPERVITTCDCSGRRTTSVKSRCCANALCPALHRCGAQNKT